MKTGDSPFIILTSSFPHWCPFPVLFDGELRLSQLELLLEFRIAFDEVIAGAFVGRSDAPAAIFFQQVLLHSDSAFLNFFTVHVHCPNQVAVNRCVGDGEISTLLNAANFHSLDGQKLVEPLHAFGQLLARGLFLKLRRQKIVKLSVLLRLEQREKVLHRAASVAGFGLSLGDERS